MAGPMTQRRFPVTLPVAPPEAFAWHQRPGALARLLPPWENIQVLRRAANIDVGSQVEFLTRVGPFPLRWLAEHTACCPPEYCPQGTLAIFFCCRT